MNRKLSCGIVAVLLAMPSLGMAADHLMKVNEIQLSRDGDNGRQMVEFFDPSAEPFPSTPYRLEVYDADGVLAGQMDLPGIFGGTPYWVATQSYQTAVGATADAVLTVTLPVNGQACFVRSTGSKIHCIAWGCINTLVGGATAGASPPDGMSLQRQSNGDLHIATPTPEQANVAGSADPACPASGDAGVSADSGPTPDLGPLADAGVTPDTGTPASDSGTTGSDAGNNNGGGDSGCAVGGAGDLSVLLLLALVALRRRS